MSENKIATLEANDGNDDLAMLENPIGLDPSPESARVEISNKTIQVYIRRQHPGADGFDVEFDIETQTVNEYAHFQSYKKSKGQSTYEFYQATKIMVLFRVDNGWCYGEPETSPHIRQKAGYPGSNLNPDSHLPTQVDGIASQNVASRGRRNDKFTKDRYKVTKRFVERVNEAYVLEWDEKHEAGRNGSYTKQTNETAYRLVAEE